MTTRTHLSGFVFAHVFKDGLNDLDLLERFVFAGLKQPIRVVLLKFGNKPDHFDILHSGVFFCPTHNSNKRFLINDIAVAEGAQERSKQKCVERRRGFHSVVEPFSDCLRLSVLFHGLRFFTRNHTHPFPLIAGPRPYLGIGSYWLPSLKSSLVKLPAFSLRWIGRAFFHSGSNFSVRKGNEVSNA